VASFAGNLFHLQNHIKVRHLLLTDLCRLGIAELANQSRPENPRKKHNFAARPVNSNLAINLYLYSAGWGLMAARAVSIIAAVTGIVSSSSALSRKASKEA
jgi:hypothetical protein